jgi:Zn-finger nucleic acid-binding protein
MRVVPNRDYFVCDYCTAFHFPPESDEGVRVLGESSHLSCPLCRVELVWASIAEIRVKYCTRCRGILTRPPNFKPIVESRRRTSVKNERPRPIDPAEFGRRISCPHCARPMDVHPYYGPGNAVIDTCGFCHFIWLDHGDLTVIIEAPDRGGW